MATCRLRKRRLCLLVVLLVFVTVLLRWLFRGGAASTRTTRDITSLERMLEPIFSTRSDRHRLSPRETLQARVLQAQSHCTRTDNAPAEHLPSILDSTHSGVHWCVQPYAISQQLVDQIRGIAQRNINTEPQLDRSRYYSLSGRKNNSATVTFIVTQHPLLRLVTAFLDLRHPLPTQHPVTFLHFVRMILERSAPPGITESDQDLLAPSGLLQSDYCQFCRIQYDFVLDGMALQSEMKLLMSDLGWQMPDRLVHGERYRQMVLLETAADLLSELTVVQIEALERHFATELYMYGYRHNFKQIYEEGLRR